MQLVKGFGLVILAVVAISFATVLIAFSPKSVAGIVKALPQTRIAGYLGLAEKAIRRQVVGKEKKQTS